MTLSCLGLGPNGVGVSSARTLAPPPPLIHAQFLGANQGTQRAKGLAENSNEQNWAAEASINALSKGVPLLAVRLAVIIV